MRVILDTNVLIAAFISHGACEELFEHLIHAHEICVPRSVLRELTEKLSGKFKFPEKLTEDLIAYLKENAVVVDAGKLPSPVCRDSEDDAVLSAAVSGNADCIITGDEDLLVLKEFDGIPILKPSGFWRFEAGREGY